MSHAPLLIEIGVEELPAVPLLKILKEIEASWGKILAERRLEGDYTFLYTPRRLVIRQESIPLRQEDRTETLWGPPVEIAFKEGEPTPAAQGFARKCGVELSELSRAKKGDREFLYYERAISGRDTEELLPQMVQDWAASMAFGKMMRWGARKEEFIRPVRWLQIRLGDRSVDAELYGVRSGTHTFVHRMVSSEPVEVNSIDAYGRILEEGKVILDPMRRRERILADMEAIEAETGRSIERDESLLDEVVAITEYPRAVEGSFEARFLELPPEVIMTSMKEHQRYFPVFADGKLANRFVVVTNAIAEDLGKVISGNERVLRPRLEDALFFYRNDLARGLQTDGLEAIQFIDGLGSLADKVKREREIALRLGGIYMDRLEAETGLGSLEIEELLDRAVSLAKADLLSEMVYEFTELQGIMGAYYARALGENEWVVRAIAEQYRPEGEHSELPSSVFSSVVAMAIKLDTLLGLFSVGKIPTGSRDPFALRRAVNGIVRIVRRYDLPFDLERTVGLLRDLYAPFDYGKLEAFFLERIYKATDVNPSLVAAVLASGERDVREIFRKLEALATIVAQPSFREIFITFKRVANISGDVPSDAELTVDPTRFVTEEERALWDAFSEVRDRSYGSYLERLEALFGLKPLLDRFFDNVLVNAEDPELRRNRQHLVASIYREFLSVADIKEISV
ncbi:glycine--tRNA ligase subunit beta [Nitratifractor sp.]